MTDIYLTALNEAGEARLHVEGGFWGARGGLWATIRCNERMMRFWNLQSRFFVIR